MTNKAIIRSFLEALDRQDFDALKEHPGLYATVVRQPLIRAAFPDLRTTIEHQIAEGDTRQMSAAVYARKSVEQHSVADEQKSVARQVERPPADFGDFSPR